MTATSPAAGVAKPAATSSAPPAAKPPLPFLVNLVFCGATGMLAWIPAHPFEMIKNRQVMIGSTGADVPGVVAVARQLMDKGGVRGGLYRGVEAGLIRQIVYGSSRVALYEPVLGAIQRLFGTSHKKGADIGFPERIMAGATAGAMGAFCSSPVEVALVRIAKSGMTNPDVPALGVLTTMRQIYSADGVLGFWRGCTPLLSRAAIVGVMQVAFFYYVHDLLKLWNREWNLHYGASTVNLTASVITGIFYSFVTMPVEVARVKMSADTTVPRRYRNMPQTIGLVLKEEGLRKMYSCYAPYLGRCGSHTVVMFVALNFITAKYWAFKSV